MPDGRKRRRSDGSGATFQHRQPVGRKKGHRRVAARKKRVRRRRAKVKRALKTVVRHVKRRARKVLKNAAKSRSYLTQYKPIDVKSAHYPFGQTHRMVTRDMNSYSRFPLLPTSLCELVSGVPQYPKYPVQPALMFSFSNLSQFPDSDGFFSTGLVMPGIDNAGAATFAHVVDTNVSCPDELQLMKTFFKKATVEAVHMEFEITQVTPPPQLDGTLSLREPPPVPGFWIFTYIPPMEVRKLKGGSAEVQLRSLMGDLLKDVEYTQQSQYQRPSNQENPTSFDASATNNTTRGFRCDWLACVTPGLRIKYVKPTTSKDRLVTARHSLDIDLRKWYGYSVAEWERFKQQPSAARMAYTNVLAPTGDTIPAANTPNYTFGVTDNQLANCVGLFGLLPDFAQGGQESVLANPSNPQTDYNTLFFFDIKLVASRYIDLDDPLDQVPAGGQL